MYHNEHNKPKRSGLFLIVFGAVLLIVAPTQYENSQELGMLALIGGFIMGGLGFYLKYVKKKRI
ncbi:MAG: hypothetical protein MK224_04560 [Candidatus Nitrosopelagicus sp.]|jgi:hypothetical protein|nr:hypothetical protein [Candidatus Nitrosopelagicus sp.]|tara:strand:+ start:156 stop:347 length:192 start_codon:yes stop_codon:yes gene_type:complete